MNEPEIVKELARRTNLPEEETAKILTALHQLVDEGTVDGAALLRGELKAELPPDDPSVVERLIARAKKHPLGLEFLASGLLATVAITMGAHAFTVEAARRRLKKEQESKEETTV